MAVSSFTDNALAAGPFAIDWGSVRFTLTPSEGPGANRPLTLSGVWNISGMGFTKEGVTLVYTADGSGVARKSTKGREKPDEISLELDPLVYKNIVEVYVCPPKKRGYRFNFEVQFVDGAGVATFSRRWTGCITTGESDNNPSDGTPHNSTFKFQPTARA